jgi:uncharacterized protein (TIGR03546 family)
MLSPERSILQRMIQRLIGGSSPSQVAAGFTLGMILGLVPKGNLIAVSMCVLLVSLRVNKAIAVAAAMAFSFASAWADSFTHKLGALVLGIDSLEPVYGWLYNLPLGPWLGFHNTVVMGSLLVGVYLAYPAYWLVGAAACRLPVSTVDAGFRPAAETQLIARPHKKPLHGAVP